MALDYKNPNDWGRSPLTDRALRLQQIKAETENNPPLTGTEFLATLSTIDDHPFSAAFGQFLGNGIDPDIANILAFGEKRFDLISEDIDDPTRQLATRIYYRFEQMNYWTK